MFYSSSKILQFTSSAWLGWWDLMLLLLEQCWRSSQFVPKIVTLELSNLTKEVTLIKSTPNFNHVLVSSNIVLADLIILQLCVLCVNTLLCQYLGLWLDFSHCRRAELAESDDTLGFCHMVVAFSFFSESFPFQTSHQTWCLDEVPISCPSQKYQIGYKTAKPFILIPVLMVTAWWIQTQINWIHFSQPILVPWKGDMMI